MKDDTIANRMIRLLSVAKVLAVLTAFVIFDVESSEYGTSSHRMPGQICTTGRSGSVHYFPQYQGENKRPMVKAVADAAPRLPFITHMSSPCAIWLIK